MEKGRPPESKRSRKPAHPVKREVSQEMKVRVFASPLGGEGYTSSQRCVRIHFPHKVQLDQLCNYLFMIRTVLITLQYCVAYLLVTSAVMRSQMCASGLHAPTEKWHTNCPWYKHVQFTIYENVYRCHIIYKYINLSNQDVKMCVNECTY